MNGYSHTIIGATANSRLNELRKYSTSTQFTSQYVGNGNYLNDGVDFINSIPNVMVIYYIGGIKYTDWYIEYYPLPSEYSLPIGLENLY